MKKIFIILLLIVLLASCTSFVKTEIEKGHYYRMYQSVISGKYILKIRDYENGVLKYSKVYKYSLFDDELYFHSLAVVETNVSKVRYARRIMTPELIKDKEKEIKELKTFLITLY